MNHKRNNHGFTLVELLVAISILGIITIIALPQISNIQNNNQKTKYKKYAETMLASGKLYVDAYTEDMFGNNVSGCVDIPYNDMRAKNLLKAIKVDGATCDFEETFIRVRKSGDHYTYETSIYCKDKNGNVVYDERLSPDGCNHLGPDVGGPIITFNKTGTNWTNNENQTIKVLVYDEYGMLENTKIKYIWVLDDTEVGEYKTYDFKNKRYEGASLENALKTEDIPVPYSSSGEYYLRVVPVDVRDINGNYQLSTVESGKFKIDKVKPTCAGNNGSTSWTGSNRTINVTCSDDKSGCEQSTYSKSFTSGTVKTSTLTIKDNAGNTNSCSFNVYVDKEAPNAPTNGSIGSVSGSDKTGKIQTASSSTTDVNNGSGFKEIRYVVQNTKSTPSSSAFTSTSRNFTRSCGTSYHAYAVAVDNVGNVSSARYLGTTSDAKDEYVNYGSCSKKCGGGTQTSSNSCALITTTNSISCNAQSCCSRTYTRDGDWSSCSASCGGGTKSKTIYIYSYYDDTLCDYDYEYKNCNTHSCEPEPEPEPEYTPYDCQLRGSTKRYGLSTWSCTCGRTHTSAYIHYCANGSGKLVTKGDNPSLNTYWYVCPNSTSGWTIIPD